MTLTGRPAAVYWARTELRTRWVALLLLGLMAGISTGLAVAALDGSHRTSIAYPAMRTSLAAADAVFFPSQVQLYDADLTEFDAMPEVAAWAGFAITSGQLDGLPPGSAPIVAIGSGWFTTIERARVVEGRLPDPSRDDEAVITEGPDTDSVGAHVGSVITWRNLSPSQASSLPAEPDATFDWTTAEGPTTAIRIVGVVRLPMTSVLSFASTGILLMGPGWAAQHLDAADVSFMNALVRLRHGAADIPTFTADVGRAFGRNDIPIKDLSQDVERVQRSLDLEANALRAFAAAVALAGVVIVAQALLRSIRAVRAAAAPVTALGMSLGDVAWGAVALHVTAAVTTMVTGLLSAVIFSRFFPIGLGRRLSPARDFRLNVPLFIGVPLAVGVAMLAIVAGRVWLSGVLVHRQRRPFTRVAGAASRAGLPVPVAFGSSFALGASRQTSGAARSALLAAVLGVAGVIGATTFVHGIDDSVREPSRAGAVWDLEAQTDAGDPQDLLNDPKVDALSEISRWPVTVDGADAPMYSLIHRKGHLDFVLLHGDAPRADGEVALAPQTAKLLDADIGNTVTIAGSAFSVVGIALVPQTPHTSFDEGGWMTPGGLTSIGALAPPNINQSGLVALARGAEADDLIASHPDWYFTQPTSPPDIVNLARVRQVPLYLAAFLALLAIGAVAHALTIGSQRRARELAIARALGLTPAQTAACIGWQAAIIALVALGIGLPLGVLLGRQLWRMITNSLSFVYAGPLATTALVVAVPVAFAIVALLSLWPARRAAHLHTADVLRRD